MKQYYSLKDQREFDYVKKNGCVIHSAKFIIILCTSFKRKNIDSDSCFMGMKVSRRYSKQAVVRNKAKRRIRSLVQDIIKSKKVITNNTSFFVIPKKEFHKANYSRLKSSFYSAFIRRC